MKKYIWLRAENNYSVGSGKISRRIIPYTKRKKRKRFKAPVVTSIFQKTTKSKKQIKFKSKAARMVFDHWNLKGAPFVRHVEKLTIRNERSAGLIEIELKKGVKAHEIIKAIDKCHDLFHADFFKYRYFYFNKKSKLSLDNFFNYLTDRHQQICKSASGIPKSWYRKCMKHDLDELIDRYKLKTKSASKYEWANDKLKKIWMEYKGLKSLTTKHESKIGVVAKKLEQLASANSRNPFITGELQMGQLPPKERWMHLIVNTVNRMLLVNRTYQPTHLGWLLTEHFYNEEIPNDIIKVNLYSKRDLDWKGIK